MANEISSELTFHEKKVTMEELFPEEKVYIESIGNYLADTFKKIDGFDYRWNSLITSNPLLFEDVDYVRCRNFVNNCATQEEIEAYKRGDLRDLYATFENMLVCNLQFYDRIMSFCTMVFLKYVRISNDELVSDGLNKLPYFFEMTPTQIWCCALSGPKSTKWELEYAWKHSKKSPLKRIPQNENQNWFELNYDLLYKNLVFARFVEYSSVRTSLTGFKQIMLGDRTPNVKLAQVCSKFTKTSMAVGEDQLKDIGNYIYSDNEIVNRLYKSLSVPLEKEFGKNGYGIYIFKNEFFIFTDKFKMKISKDINNKITKEYISNSYECFLAEILLKETILDQIAWAKYKEPIEFDYEKQLLSGLLYNMLDGKIGNTNKYKLIKCVKWMPDGNYSEITFKGAFSTIIATETYRFDNRRVHENTVNYGIPNMVNYIINRGYFIFGTIHDVDILFVKDVTRDTLVNHYSNYCIPVIEHMENVINLHIQSKNDIIDVLCNGVLNPLKLNNNNIKYTMLKGNKIDNKDIMNQIKKLSNNIINDNENKKRSYWAVIK